MSRSAECDSRARIAYATMVAHSAAAGVDVSGFEISGLQAENLWPFPE